MDRGLPQRCRWRNLPTDSSLFLYHSIKSEWQQKPTTTTSFAFLQFFSFETHSLIRCPLCRCRIYQSWKKWYVFNRNVKKGSKTEHGDDMKPLNIETENKEFKSPKSIKYSCKILQFLSVLFLLPSYKAQDWLVTAPCLYINFTVLQKLLTVFVQCKRYQILLKVSWCQEYILGHFPHVQASQLCEMQHPCCKETPKDIWISSHLTKNISHICLVLDSVSKEVHLYTSWFPCIFPNKKIYYLLCK